MTADKGVRRIPVPAVMAGLFLYAFALRAAGLFDPLKFEERDFIFPLFDISFHSPIWIPLAVAHHPCLMQYVAGLGTFLLGDTGPGIRIMNVVMGSLLPLALFALLRSSMGLRCALFAGILAASDLFLVTWSPYFHVEMQYLCFSAFAMMAAWRAMAEENTGWLMTAALCAGLSLATKQNAIIYITVLIVFMGLSRYRGFVFSRRGLAAAVIVAMGIVPWLLWQWMYGWESLAYEVGLVDRLSPHLSLLRFWNLPGLMSWESFWQGVAANRIFPLAGGLYLLGLVLGLFRWRRPLVRYLTVLLVFHCGIFSFIESLRLWWFSYSLLPAICLAAILLDSLYRRGRAGKAIVLAVLGLVAAAPWLNALRLEREVAGIWVEPRLKSPVPRVSYAFENYLGRPEYAYSWNDAVQACIRTVEEFRPGLLVTPDLYLDQVATHAEFYTGVRALPNCPFYQHDYMKRPYRKEELRNILVILTRPGSVAPWVEWFANAGYKVHRQKVESVVLRSSTNAEPFRLYWCACLFRPSSDEVPEISIRSLWEAVSGLDVFITSSATVGVDRRWTCPAVRRGALWNQRVLALKTNNSRGMTKLDVAARFFPPSTSAPVNTVVEGIRIRHHGESDRKPIRVRGSAT